MTYTYRNKTDQKLMIPNIGEVEPNKTIISEIILENQNLEDVSASAQQKHVSETKPAETK